MNKILGLAILAILAAGPAHAQRSFSGTSVINGTGLGIGNGGGGGAGSSVGGGGAVTFRTLPPTPPTAFQVTSVSGVGSEFVPSSWTQFEKGLAEGKAQLALERKTLGEVAAEYRRTEKPKAKLAFVQDAYGNAVIERQ